MEASACYLACALQPGSSRSADFGSPAASLGVTHSL